MAVWERSLSGIRVLLVEDDSDTRDVLALGLELSGAEVTAVGSAAAALEALPRIRPHVLLSDIGMSGEDGYELIRRIRQMPAAEGGHVPAAAVTAFTLADDRQRALKAGYMAHFAKPVDTRTLIQTVASLARRAHYLKPHGLVVDRRLGDRRRVALTPRVQRRAASRRAPALPS
jgi:CheY-like chemotaxis protein